MGSFTNTRSSAKVTTDFSKLYFCSLLHVFSSWKFILTFWLSKNVLFSVRLYLAPPSRITIGCKKPRCWQPENKVAMAKMPNSRLQNGSPQTNGWRHSYFLYTVYGWKLWMSVQHFVQIHSVGYEIFYFSLVSSKDMQVKLIVDPPPPPWPWLG